MRHVRTSWTADLPRLAIYDGDARVSTTAHLARHGVAVRIGQGAKFPVAVATFRKGERGLDLGLRLDEASTIVLKAVATLDPSMHIWGIRSTFRIAGHRRSVFGISAERPF